MLCFVNLTGSVPVRAFTAGTIFWIGVAFGRPFMPASLEGNLKTVVRNATMPYIPFKSNSTVSDKRSSSLWRRMFHYYMYNQESFMQHFHQRSIVESTFMIIKAKFGDSLRSKTERAEINEVLCKVLCHNICCLIQSMYELGLKPKFWALVA